MTILNPHNIHPLKQESSSHRDEYGSSSASPSVGHPCWTYWRTLDNSLSCFIHLWMSLAVTEDSAKCSANKSSSGSSAVVAGSSGRGNRLRASALA